ncbi:SDR family oxidoreductase [Kineococcus radiotolerans]|uniref:NmrA family protein n=1 Tax=Kineococcus radiotolerans (strain ATCC BAA-149 / DSM 14245 / SRS30216) TaxID=266940 RepID=A6WBD8_KINRD|nr:SDR family oxidoreductase [Kineococcus radiotolerans]ABS04127.1 NmrA family protein [Kineococcus radiotolerans SRS30216 = ATCC BAA-149]
MTTYAVTGATGHLGRLAVEDLLTRGVPAADVIAIVRTPAKAADLAERGVQVREGDYDRPDTLPAALAGVERLLLVSGSEIGRRLPQHEAVITAAKAAGVSRIVYTSLLKADTTSLPIAGEHVGTEALLREAGVPFTVLRNGWYTENYTGQLSRYLGTGAVVGATAAGRISAATRADFAAAAVSALVDGAEATGAVRELGGPAFTLAELAATITEVTGTPVAHQDLSGEQYSATLQQASLDEGTAGFFAAVDAAIAHGDLHTDSDALTRLLGRPATSLSDAVRAAHTTHTA